MAGDRKKQVLSPEQIERKRACKAAWNKANTARVKAYNQSWQAANISKVRALSAAWYEANAEKARANSARWRAENPDKARAYNAAWAKANPRSRSATEHRRRAHGAMTAGDIRAVTEMGDGVCSYCLTPGLELTVDHVVPVSRGGTNDPENLVMACRSCNSRKRTRTPIEYLMRIRLA